MSRTRRRFLTDCLFLGGALFAASQVRPFFHQFLESQTPSPTPTSPTPSPLAQTPAPPPVPDVTEAYPSDSDLHEGRRPGSEGVTKAYPSDSDLHEERSAPMTQAYPSDSDMHEGRPFPVKPKQHSQIAPLWKRWS